MTTDPGLQRASTDNDLLPVVDEHDEVIDAMPRRQVHLQGLRHRAVHIVVLDPQGRAWLQLRSRHKDTWPHTWDWTATGHVDCDETYDQAAVRELAEEVGLHIDTPPRRIGRHTASASTGWEFQSVYGMVWPHPLTDFAPHEVAQMRPFTLDEIRSALAGQSPQWSLAPGIRNSLPLVEAITIEDLI